MEFRYAVWLRVVGVLLGLQFVLGIWLALFGTFPSTHSVEKTILDTGDPILLAHMGLAVLLVLLTFVVTIYAFRPEAPSRLRWYMLGCFLSLLGAYEAGVELIMSGFSSNLDSGAMLLAFVLAAAFLGVAQWYLRRSPPIAAPAAGIA